MFLSCCSINGHRQVCGEYLFLSCCGGMNRERVLAGLIARALFVNVFLCCECGIFVGDMRGLRALGNMNVIATVLV